MAFVKRGKEREGDKVPYETVSGENLMENALPKVTPNSRPGRWDTFFSCALIRDS